MTRCTCGTEVRKLDGKLYQEHTRQRHFAALNGKGKRRPKAPKPKPEEEMTEEEVRRMLADRAAEMEKQGRVGR